MTIRSTKISSNNTNTDSTSNQQQQLQNSSATRTRLPYDDELSNGGNSSLNIIEDASNDTNRLSSLSLTTADNLQTMITTESPTPLNHLQHKSSNCRNHGYSTKKSNKLTRRTCNSMQENSLSKTSSSIVNDGSVNGDNDPYNSEDEYDQTTIKHDQESLDELEIRFQKALKEKKGFVIRPVKNDGACLFRAIADQVYGDEEMHAVVRQNCMDYIVKNADYFRAYITEDFDQYVQRKRQLNCHGNHIEIIALSELYNRPIEVYEYRTEPIDTVHGMYKTDNDPIRLSYHSGVHYNSIVDPWRPTAGHGLGLPDLQPGRAQESLILTALRESEDSHIERTMLDDKLAATDWEATQDELMKEIARESYLQWLCDTNQQKIDNKTTSSSSSTVTESCDKISERDETNAADNLLPLKLNDRRDCEFNLPLIYGDASSSHLGFDDDDSLMQQVLAMSQLEYFEQLKQQPEQRDVSTSNENDQCPSSSDASAV